MSFTKPTVYVTFPNAARGGLSHGNEYLAKFVHVVLEICNQTYRQTLILQYSVLTPGAIIHSVQMDGKILQ